MIKLGLLIQYKIKLSYFITFVAITIPSLCSLAQNSKENHLHLNYLPDFEFKIESGITQLLIMGGYSVKVDSEINSNLNYIELINHSEKRKIEPQFSLGVGVDYNLTSRLSFGVMYRMGIKQILNENGSISSVKVIGPNTITTKSSGNYSMISEINNSTLMASVASNFFIARMNPANIVLNYGVAFGYSNIKATTYVSNAQFSLSMYSESFNPKVHTVGSITNEVVKENTYCWSVFSNVSLEFINVPKVSIGYKFARLGEITLIERESASVNLIQSYLFNNEQESNTIETLSLVTNNSRLKLFSHNFSITIIF